MQIASSFVLVLAICIQPYRGSSAFAPSHSKWSSGWCVNTRTPIQMSVDGASSKERKPWDVLRFINQSSKFVTPPKLPFIGATSDEKVTVQPGETLWAPSSKQNFFSFAPLDDVVMGGASSSTIDNNTGIWRGKVTDANNGGFVGIRSTPFKNNKSLDMRNCEGIELKVRKGDGKRFKFVVRDTTEFNGICWTTSFDAAEPKENSILGSFGSGFGSSSGKDGTADEKGTLIRLPFANQVPTIFAKTVSGKSFDAKNVVGLQLAYSKFEFDGKLNQNFALGDFTLQILEIRAY
ncbi:hypothetical protein ACHAWO_009857 [Cyclotella atomus]|uniref:NADH:ubiquinone oxidoreductase intermediate-associated protein 30 domain-containing protein n=1 Tax=Cyclotella atomus TaxID=382360 RepID=A0ABD3QWS4_9STRA